MELQSLLHFLLPLQILCVTIIVTALNVITSIKELEKREESKYIFIMLYFYSYLPFLVFVICSYGSELPSGMVCLTPIQFCFQDFPFCLWLSAFLHMSGCGSVVFILFGAHLVSQIQRFMFFIKFGKCSVIISSNVFPTPFSFSSLSNTLACMHVRCT